MELLEQAEIVVSEMHPLLCERDGVSYFHYASNLHGTCHFYRMRDGNGMGNRDWVSDFDGMANFNCSADIYECE